MTLRLDGSDKAIGTVIYDASNEVLVAEKSTDAETTVSLVVQGNNGTYSFSYSRAVEGTVAVSADEIKTACGISKLSLADCEIWLETVIDGLSYVKTAEAAQIETMRPVVITPKDADIEYTGAQIDVSEYFEIDPNAGAAEYYIADGTGMGILDGSILTVKKAGTFEIGVNTAATALYAPGEAVACLNVKYDLISEFDINRDGAANVLDLVRLKKIIAGVAESDGASPDLDGNGSPDAADITILKKFLLGVITVKSDVQLREALELLSTDAAGGRIALNNDIVIDTAALSVNSKTENQTVEITIDLNGHKLSGTDVSLPDANSLIESFDNTSLSIENGTLEFDYLNLAGYGVHSAIFKVGGSLRLKNCRVNSNGSAAIFGVDSSVELENCGLYGGFDRGDGKTVTVLNNGSAITVKGNALVENYFLCRDTNSPWSITLKADGSYSLNGESLSVTEDTTYYSDNQTNPNWLLNMNLSVDS